MQCKENIRVCKGPGACRPWVADAAHAHLWPHPSSHSTLRLLLRLCEMLQDPPINPTSAEAGVNGASITCKQKGTDTLLPLLRSPTPHPADGCLSPSSVTDAPIPHFCTFLTLSVPQLVFFPFCFCSNVTDFLESQFVGE